MPWWPPYVYEHLYSSQKTDTDRKTDMYMAAEYRTQYIHVHVYANIHKNDKKLYTDTGTVDKHARRYGLLICGSVGVMASASDL